MSIRPSIVHQCFDQNKILAWVQPWIEDGKLTKDDFNKLWKDAAKVLKEVRKLNCRCSYRVTTDEAEILVKHGIADYLITEWRFNEEKKRFFPAPNVNLVWGGKQAEDLGLVRGSKALMTPRVMTIEKANLERGYLVFSGDSRKKKAIGAAERERIEVWGELARGVITDLTTEYEGEIHDPTEGKPVISIPFGWDPRTCPGKNV